MFWMRESRQLKSCTATTFAKSYLPNFTKVFVEGPHVWRPRNSGKLLISRVTGQLSQLTANMNTDGFGPPSGRRNVRMKREKFVTLVEEALAALRTRFRKRIHNVAVLVENVPPGQLPRRGSRNTGIIDSDNTENLVLGVFEGVPTTKKSVFDLPAGPDRIVLYQMNIEAVCSNEEEIRKEIRLTVIHELGHYFGMTEAQPEDV